MLTSPKLVINNESSTLEINWSTSKIKTSFTMPIKNEQQQAVTFADIITNEFNKD